MRIIVTAIAETAKVRESTTNAHPVPKTAMMRPPIKGPISV